MVMISADIVINHLHPRFSFVVTMIELHTIRHVHLGRSCACTDLQIVHAAMSVHIIHATGQVSCIAMLSATTCARCVICYALFAYKFIGNCCLCVL